MSTTTDYTDINDLDLNGLDLGLADARFQEPASTERDVVPAGFYYLQMPERITTTVETDDRDGSKHLLVKLDGLKIATHTPDGEVQLPRKDGTARASGAFVDPGGFNKSISTRKFFNGTSSDVLDLMVNFGLVQKGEALTAEQLKENLTYIQGKVTPKPVKVEPQGYYVDDGVEVGTKPGPGFGKANKKGYITVYGSKFKDEDGTTVSSIMVPLANGDSVEVKGWPTVQSGPFGRAWAGKPEKRSRRADAEVAF